MAVVVVHAEFGIYLGSCMGLGFWSLLDMAGQEAACTFKDAADARDFISTWDENSNPDQYGYVPVKPDNGDYITTTALIAAGLSALLPSA